MVKRVTVDSSVIISSLLPQELRNKEALDLWKNVLVGDWFAVMPYSILVEVVSAIRRRTGSEDLARQTKKQLLSIQSLSFVVLDDASARKAAEIAAITGLRGMDALVVQVAKEYKAQLISFDKKMIEKAGL